jgi:hypothetical protein
MHDTLHINIHSYIAVTCLYEKGEVPKVKMTFGISSVARICVNKSSTPIFVGFLSKLGIRENLRYILHIKSILKL